MWLEEKEEVRAREKASLFVSSGALLWHQDVPSPDNQP